MELIFKAYKGYYNYLINELSDPFNNGGSYFYLLILISLLAWSLEILFPWRKNQAIFRKDFWVDAFFMFFNFFIFNLIIFIALSSVSERYFLKFMTTIGAPTNGLINLSSLHFIIQLVLFFIIADFVQWLIHILLHRIPLLWRFHKVHHSVTEMGFAAHLRYHWVETLVYKTGLYIILAYIFHFELKYAFYLHSFTILIGHLNHSNIPLNYGPLKFLINNPKMHIWHHAKDLPDKHPFGMNFGISLSIWDYLFRTAYIPSDGKNIALGFPNINKYPTNFFKLLIQPFRNEK